MNFYLVGDRMPGEDGGSGVYPVLSVGIVCICGGVEFVDGVFGIGFMDEIPFKVGVSEIVGEMSAFKIVKCPAEALALTYNLIFHPDDFGGPYVVIGGKFCSFPQ